MKPYKNINWEYTQSESLEIDQDNLDLAKIKLSRNINPMAREYYVQEVEEIIEKIKCRELFILNNK